MTFIGKLFVMINLAISLLMAVTAFGLYASGIDWTDRAAKEGQPEGKMQGLRKEIDDVVARLSLAEGSWKAARQEVRKITKVVNGNPETEEIKGLLVLEDERRKERLWGDGEMAKLIGGQDQATKDPTASPPGPDERRRKREAKARDSEDQVSRVEYGEDANKIPIVILDAGRPKMILAESAPGLPLMTREVYEERLAKYQEKNTELRESLAKLVHEDKRLTWELAGGVAPVRKPVESTPKKRGLRHEIAEERVKRLGLIDEQGITRALEVNVAVESELILKRLDALDERILELGRYLKKKHNIDVPAKWR